MRSPGTCACRAATIDEIAGAARRAMRSRGCAKLKFTGSARTSSPQTSCRRSRSACTSWARSASITSRSTARRRRSAAANRSASASRRSSARICAASSTCSMSRPSACTRATMPRCSTRSTPSRRKGNSLVIVEHDEDTMRRADTIIDLGPGAGSRGGEVVAQGTLAEIQNHASAPRPGACLREPLQHPTRGARRPLDDVDPLARSAAARALHNLKNVDVRFPVGRLTVLTGISGSGKSTLMRGVLKPRAAKRCAPTQARRRSAAVAQRQPWQPTHRGGVGAIIEAVYEVDQSPIGKTSRSTPGDLHQGLRRNPRALRADAARPDARLHREPLFLQHRGRPLRDLHGPGRDQGRDELPADELRARARTATASATTPPRSRCSTTSSSIGDVMQMTLDEAAEFFAAHPKIHRPLALLCDTGLGYLQLGQPSPTLSGGEAQRLKLVSRTAPAARPHRHRAHAAESRAANRTLYLLEEPTIGLHMADVARAPRRAPPPRR